MKQPSDPDPQTAAIEGVAEKYFAAMFILLVVAFAMLLALFDGRGLWLVIVLLAFGELRLRRLRLLDSRNRSLPGL